MKTSPWTIAFAIGATLGINQSLAQQIGEATLVKTTVTGDGGTLVTQSPVHRDERIRTSESGLGEFLFRDGTRFAVGPNSSIVLDKFVFDDQGTAKTVTIRAAKGVFRWISGKSKSSAYQVITPAGTLGVRGTVLDIYVGDDGTTAVVLLEGEGQFCSRNGSECRDLKQVCDYVVATPEGGISEVKQVDESFFKDLGTRSSMPFQTGDQELSEEFRVPSCLIVAGGPSVVAPATLFGAIVGGALVLGAFGNQPVSD